MTRGRTQDLLHNAAANGYAVPAVNIIDNLSLTAVVGAAQHVRAPIIVQTSVKTVRTIGARLLAAMVTEAADQVAVPVALHLDHCPDRDVIRTCLHHGWSSVLFDASDRSLGQATHETRDVVAEAHDQGATVEAEIENIVGVEDGIGSDLEGSRYSIDTIADFVEHTGCDYFAPALGTRHGLQSDRPNLDYGRAGDLRRRLGIPLVLHGGTGLTSEEFGQFITAGCSKVNISTTLKRAYMLSALTHLQQANDIDRWDPPSLFAAIAAAIQEDTERHIRFFGAASQS